MIRLVLDDLGRLPAEGFPVLLPGTVQVFHFYVFVSGGLSDSGQGKAALLRFIGSASCDDDRIVHDKVQKAQAYDDDPLSDPDHVGGKAHAPVPVGGQGILQVLPGRQIRFRGRVRFLSQKKDVSYDGSVHNSSLIRL